MTWAAVVEYLETRAPSVLASSVGVEESELAEFERRIGRSLPTEYRAFLLHAGISAGRLNPFGWKWEHRFDELWTGDPEEIQDFYVPDLILRVAQNADESAISPEDYFLDLRSDENELLFAEPYGPYEHEHLRPVGLTLCERIFDYAFHAAHSRRSQQSFRWSGEGGKSVRTRLNNLEQRLVSHQLTRAPGSTNRVLVLDGHLGAVRLVQRGDSRFLHVTCGADTAAQCTRLYRSLHPLLPGLEALP